MNIDEDTFGWLGLPTALEMYRQRCCLLEDEIQERYPQSPGGCILQQPNAFGGLGQKQRVIRLSVAARC